MKRRLARAFCAAVLALSIPVAGHAEDGFAVRAQISFSDDMLNRQDHVTNKAARMLRARQSGELEGGKLYLGGRFLASQIFETTSKAGKFPILSRLPPTHTSGTSDT